MKNMNKYKVILFAFSFFVIAFQIHADTPSITVTSPNSGFEAIESGQKVEIRWDSTISGNALVDVYVSDGTHKGAVVRTSNNGALGLIYTLTNDLIPGSNYKAYVSLVAENLIVIDSSDNPFTVKPINVVSTNTFTPSITVTSPNDTHIAIDPGQKIEIRWDTNVSGNALVDVYVSDGTHKGHVVRGNNSGSLIYTPASNLPAGSNYKAYVSLVSEIPTKDSSEFPFTIRPVKNNEAEDKNTVIVPIQNIPVKGEIKSIEAEKQIDNDKKDNTENEPIKIEHKSKLKTFLVGTEEGKFSLFGWLIKLFR
jgi:hypothetical protein